MSVFLKPKKQTNNKKQRKHSEQEENNYYHKSHRAQDCHTIFVTVRTSIYFRAVIFRSISRSEISFKKQELLQCSGYYSHCQSHLMPRTRPTRGDSWLYEPQYQDPRRGKRCAAGFKTKQSFHCFLGSWGYLYLITEWGELVKAKTIGRLG